MIFKISSIKDARWEEGGLSKSYLDELGNAGFKPIEEKDEFGDLVYKIRVEDLSSLRLIHKVIRQDFIISFPEVLPREDGMPMQCHLDDAPIILIYDDVDEIW